ncbi:MAG: hypothetical protein C0521_05565 [Xanthomonas sp.]|uniref:hypothetical protein n=1 Tax=Pseudoxanthomonas mexicana TaxID=128785 RepID=UPI000785A265|nr:hypothetical protein [Pseudoxanthomonas mexicana]MBA3929043.1 hypothetical protein [Xanthomonas sp.]
MTLRTFALVFALLYSSAASVTSCGIDVVVVNHRQHAITVQLKSFHAERTLPAPAHDDFDAPVYDGDAPPYLSSLEQVDIPANDTVHVKFRRLCAGDFWLNWRTVPATGKAASGQLRPYHGQPIDIR